jgi:LmbE family N-acetylglucosaminyl deacetylase
MKKATIQTRKEFLAVLTGATASAAQQTFPARTPKVLLVVAHPDDEYAVAATVYRITQELKGVVDQLIITNGEGGFRYSQLAEAFYGLQLTDEATGRSRLPEIRRREALAAGRILGIRRHYFLKQKDSKFNTDGSEPLGGLWDREAVSAQLQAVLQRERYQYLFVLLPTQETHGHHQAAAFLALEEVRRMPEAQRPIVLAAQASEDHGPSVRFMPRADYPIFRALEDRPSFIVDRLDPLGPGGQLNYNIIVNWVIAEHKSQGLFQTESGKHSVEHFWVFDTGRKDAMEVASALFSRLTSPIRHPKLSHDRKGVAA